MKFLLCTALALATVSAFGSATDEVDAKYRGEWLLASLAEGDTNPIAVGCIDSDLGSYKAKAVVAENKIDFLVTDFIGTKDCTGTNTISGKITYNLTIESTETQQQILRAPTHSYAYTLAGELTIKQMNEANVCGHSDWQIGTYKSTDPKMQNCKESKKGENGEEDQKDNTSGYLPPYRKPDSEAHLQLRLRLVGKGMALDERDTTKEGSTFVYPYYFARP